MKDRRTVTIPSLDQVLQLIYPGEEGKMDRERMIFTVAHVLQRSKMFTEGVQKECLGKPAPQKLALILHRFSMTEAMLGGSLRGKEVLELDTSDSGYQRYLREYLGQLEKVVGNLALRETDSSCKPVGVNFVELLAKYLLTHADHLEDDELRDRYLRLVCKLAKIGINTYKGIIGACESLSKSYRLSTETLVELLRVVYNSQQELWHKSYHERWRRVLFWGILHGANHEKEEAGIDFIDLIFKTSFYLSQLSPFGVAQFNHTLNEIRRLDTSLQKIIGELGEGVTITDKAKVQVEARIQPTYIGITLHKDTEPPKEGSSPENATAALREEFPGCEVMCIKTHFTGV